jgi:acetyl-CoA C-acetyltransferase
MAEAFIVAAARTAGGKRKGGRWPAGTRWTWPPRCSMRWSRAAGRPRAGRRRDHGLRRPGRRAVDQRGAQRGAGQPGLPESVPGTSVDRQCGSSQQALHFAAQAVMSGTMDIVIAAGVESMTRVPMGTPSRCRARPAWAPT